MNPNTIAPSRVIRFTRIGGHAPWRRALLTAALALGTTGALSLPETAAAESVKFSATLNGGSEVPSNTTAGTGTLDATLNKDTGELSYTVTYSGLTGAATMGHFHGPALAGVNAGVVVPFKNPVSPIEGKATLTPAQVADLTTGKWYVNVHTAEHPGGEIRGQVVPAK